MDEVRYTQFQIVPPKLHSVTRRCMFKNSSFDMNDIVHISEVSTYAGMNFFFFDVKFAPQYGAEFTLTYKSPTKSESLRWQRELTRAWCGIGEFADVAKGNSE